MGALYLDALSEVWEKTVKRIGESHRESLIYLGCQARSEHFGPDSRPPQRYVITEPSFTSH
jgi:hypothetical protein